MEDGNVITPVEKYETRSEKYRKKPCYDKVFKALGLVKEELDEKDIG